MKLYLVIRNMYEVNGIDVPIWSLVDGIFSSEEKAKEHVIALMRDDEKVSEEFLKKINYDPCCNFKVPIMNDPEQGHIFIDDLLMAQYFIEHMIYNFDLDNSGVSFMIGDDEKYLSKLGVLNWTNPIEGD